MLKQLRATLVVFLLLSLVTGVVYPMVVTGLGQAFFPFESGGSILIREGRPVGSALIGQNFTQPRYFWPRPSATSPEPYNAAASSGSNLGPTNPALVEAVRARITALRQADPQNRVAVPVDLVTTSASGLDPHISPAAAEFQVGRVAQARGTSPEHVRELVVRHTQGRTLGFLGEARVNVLELNLDLDASLP